MPTRKFERTIEDFICDNCSNEVRGNGYTNHCPKCLWSKHVDVNPGDRESSCLGLMEPVELEVKSSFYSIVHKCVKCGIKKTNKALERDNFEALIKLS